MDNVRLTDDEYSLVYSLVPRACVDLVIINGDSKILLTQRDIEPNKGRWHLPGGRLKKDESIAQAIKRISKSELGNIEVVDPKLVDFMEFIPDGLLKNGTPLHSVSLTFKVNLLNGEIIGSSQAANFAFFKREEIPSRDQMIIQHFDLLKNLKFD